MSNIMEEEFKRWTARRKIALVLEIIQGKTTFSEASRQYDLVASEIYEREIKTLQEAYDEAMLELSARKKCSPCWAKKSHDRRPPTGNERGRLYSLDLKAFPVV